MSGSAPAPAAVAGFVPLAGFYILFFCGVGVAMPFLPTYLKSLGFAATDIGVLLALGPLMTLIAPPLWGRLADRTGRPDRILGILGLGAAVGFSALLWAESLALVAAALAVYGVFHAGVVPLIDSLTLQRAAAGAGAYSHVRLFGSLGFIASATVFGLLSDEIGPAAIAVPLVFMGAYSLWSLTLRSAPSARGPIPPRAGWTLAQNRDLALFLAAACLHWIACAPYHGIYGIHVTALGLPPAVLGITFAAGAAAEVCVMFLYPRFADRLAPRYVLSVAFVASAARWVGVALTSSAGVLIALSMLHAMTFGAFYIASMAFLARRIPPERRASGQGLFSSVAFGLGGLVGFLLSGRAYDLLGGHQLFALAAVVDLIAAVLVVQASAAPPPPDEAVADVDRPQG